MSPNDYIFLAFIAVGVSGWLILLNTSKARVNYFFYQKPTLWLWLLPVIFLLSILRFSISEPFQPSDSYGRTLTQFWQQTAHEVNQAVGQAQSISGPWLIEVWFSVRTAKLLEMLFSNAVEELSRLGVLFLLTLLVRRQGFALFIFIQIVIGLSFSLSHNYSEEFSQPLAFAAHIYALILSFVLTEVLRRYGLVAAYICHILQNILNLQIIFYSSTWLIWLNWVFALLVTLICFFILRKTAPSPVWLNPKLSDSKPDKTTY